MLLGINQNKRKSLYILAVSQPSIKGAITFNQLPPPREPELGNENIFLSLLFYTY